MGKRDKRRSRDRRRAKRHGATFRRRRLKLKLVTRAPLTFEEVWARLPAMIREAARIDRERRAGPKQFEYGEGILDVGEYIELACDLGVGSGEARVLTNDLTHAYVDENMGTS